MISVGQSVADYRLLRVLGEGGMGIVYEAEKAALGARVALKVLSDSIADDPLAIERFQQEAKAAAAINHPNVVKVFDFGVHDGRCFYAMQLVNGLSLSDLIRRRRGEAAKNPGPTAQFASAGDSLFSISPVDQALVDSARPSGTERSSPRPRAVIHRPDTLHEVAQRYFDDPYWFTAQVGLQAARGLAEAHRHDLVHRDVKPSNLMIDRHGQAYVIDFGLVRSMSKTRSEFRRGTLRYMSPEQLDLQELDARTDIYSLGASLYQLVAGQPPFDGESESSVAAKIRAGRFRPLREVAPGCPPDLARIIERALKHHREERFPSAAAMASALEHCQAATDSDPVDATRTFSETPASPLPHPRSDWRRKSLAAAVCLAIGLFVFSGFGATGASPPEGDSGDASDVEIVRRDSIPADQPVPLYPFGGPRSDAETSTELVAPEVVLMRDRISIAAHGGDGIDFQLKDSLTRGLLRLGQTRAPRYKLRVEVSGIKSHWETGRIQEVGLFYGGRWLERIDGTRFYRATTLGILLIPNLANPASGELEYRLQLLVTQTTDDGQAVANNELGSPGGSDFLGPVDDQRHAIEVQIGPQGVEGIWWDGKSIGSTKSLNDRPRFLTADDWVGDFGLSSQGCDAILHKPTFSLVSGDDQPSHAKARD